MGFLPREISPAGHAWPAGGWFPITMMSIRACHDVLVILLPFQDRYCLRTVSTIPTGSVDMNLTACDEDDLAVERRNVAVWVEPFTEKPLEHDSGICCLVLMSFGLLSCCNAALFCFASCCVDGRHSAGELPPFHDNLWNDVARVDISR